MSNEYCWFDHDPIVGQILMFLAPCDVFLDARQVCKSWKEFVESEIFAKSYFREVMARDCQGEEVFHVEVPDLSSNYQPISNEENMIIERFRILERDASPIIKSLSWKDHFYFKFLLCIGFSVRKRKPEKNPLLFLEECLTTGQLEFMREKFKGWGLKNLLKKDLILCLSRENGFMMFKYNGEPFLFLSNGFDRSEVLSYRTATFFDNDDYVSGIQMSGISKIFPEESKPLRLSQTDTQIWEDYISCVHPAYKYKRVNNIEPYQVVIQTRFMSDYQHTELSQKAKTHYYNNVYLKWRPTILWHE